LVGGFCLENAEHSQVVFLVAILLYFLMSRTLPSTVQPNTMTLYALSVLALAEVLAIFIIRWILVSRSEHVLLANPSDRNALGKWRVGYLAMYSVALGIALYGFVLHFLGFALTNVVPFFAVGFLLIVVLPPRRLVDTR
jgi:hypothetical protein